MTAPDFPALVAAARDRMDLAERWAKDATPAPWQWNSSFEDDLHEAAGWVGHDRAGDGFQEFVCATSNHPDGLNDGAHLAFWDPGMALGVIRWGRDVLDRHRPRANQDGRPDACPECFGGISADDPDEDRPCGCWGLSDPICGTCAQDGTAARRYPQFWPCDDVLGVLRAWVPDLLDEEER